MLVLRLEKWPGGDERRKELLGTLEIVNDCTGAEDVGNYEASLRMPTGDSSHTYIQGADRGDHPKLAWRLAMKVLQRLV